MSANQAGASIDCKVVPSNIQYGIIQLGDNRRDFFPGYNVQFVLETIMHSRFKDFVMHLTGSDDGTAVGENSGCYICHPRPGQISSDMSKLVPDSVHRSDGSFLRFYEARPDIVPGTILTVEYVASKRYRISEVKLPTGE